MRENRGSWLVVGFACVGCSAQVIAFTSHDGSPDGGTDPGSRPTTGMPSAATGGGGGMGTAGAFPTGSAGSGIGAGAGGVGGTMGSGGSGGASVNSKDLWIAFDSSDGSNRDIHVMRPDGMYVKRLTSDPSNEQEPAFSADGRSLAFASDRTGQAMQIHRLALGTGVISPVTSRAGGAHWPAFSPDGARIAFRSGRSIYTVAIDGSDEREIATAPTDAPSGRPAYTLDGQWIIYDNYNTIHAVHPDGTGDYEIVPSTTAEQSNPAVSPDGSMVALQATCGDGAVSIWIVLKSGAASWACASGRRLSPPGSPDARHLAWGSPGLLGNVVAWDLGQAEGDIVVGRADGVGAPTVMLRPGDERNPAWSPIGTKLP